jgi:adsorption protein B
MDWISLIRIFGFILILIYFICGIDDTLWIIFSMISGLLRRKKDEDADDVLDFDRLRNTPPKMLAVTIAAWHEANVIGNVITNFLNTTDYPKSMYHLFVGVYPNDPETIAAVEEVGKTFPNVHVIVNCLEGPTTKAQNLNHVIRQIKAFEKENGVRFAALTVHDSEDVIHTYELLATNYLIDRHDALQFPVFPIMEMPRFRNFFRQLTTATYADEFAENHYITLVERRNAHAFVPCAGTGFALSRSLLEKIGDADVLPTGILTEDYMLSLSLFKKGVSFHYVLNRLPRVMKNGKQRTDYITTRSLFPATFKAAVRQKTRWTYGITMQSVSIRDVFGANGVSLIGRYTFFKDLKAKVLNLLPLLGYIASIYCILAVVFSLEPLYTRDSPVFYLALAVFAFMLIRQFFRGFALYHVYGLRSVFFGCLLPPLFPIRLIYGNIINFVATVRAFRLKLFGDRAANKTVKKEHRQKAEKTVKWAKTDHEFLSRDQLRAYRRMLGDMLIVQGYLSPEQFQDALAHVDKQHGEQIGAYLVRTGVITEEQMIRALGHVKHIQFIPDDVLRSLDYEAALSQFDRAELLEKKLLPLTNENGVWIVGVCNETKDADLEAFQAAHGLRIRRMYLMEPMIEEALRAPEAGQGQKAPLALPLEAYHAGQLSYEQVVLVGMFMMLQSRPAPEIREYMGI